MNDETLAATRRSLHAVAELLIAGPQYRLHQTIRLEVTAGGIGGKILQIRIEGAELVWPDGRAPLTGTCRELARLAGVEPGVAQGVYKDTSGVSLDEQLSVDPAAAALVLGWFAMGDKALRAFEPTQEPVLWPEHFDLGIAVDEVNYGISPGDSGIGSPYAYVGPWTPQTGPFWNAPFGAAQTVDDLPSVESIVQFFEDGKRSTNRV
jgi:hypothetical protein